MVQHAWYAEMGIGRLAYRDQPRKLNLSIFILCQVLLEVEFKHDSGTSSPFKLTRRTFLANGLSGDLIDEAHIHTLLAQFSVYQLFREISSSLAAKCSTVFTC